MLRLTTQERRALVVVAIMILLIGIGLAFY